MRHRSSPWMHGWLAPLAVALAVSAGGCSYQLDSMAGDIKTTGSVLRPTAQKQVSTMPPEHDLVVARAAVSEAMTTGGKDSSVPWENPRTGARGTITPIASAYSEGGLTCHDFLASYVRNGTEAWLQGEACRARQGRWEVRELKPWQ